MIWSTYQTDIFEAFTNTQDSLLIEAVAGCLAGDTIIGVNRGGKSYNETISCLTYMQNGGTRCGNVFSPHIATRIRAAGTNNEVVRLRLMSKAIASGVKFTHTLTTASGHSVRATGDHRFLTTIGWRPLKSIMVGDSVLVDAGKSKVYRHDKPAYRHVYKMDYHPFKSVTHNRGRAYWRVPEHRLVMEASLNGTDYDIFMADVQTGEIEGYEFLDPNVVHVHHKDEDSLNNALENLVMMTPNEHKRYHARKGGWKNVQANIAPSEVVSIDPFGEEETFDITMADGEEPNFLANGIVVHNSGKTRTLEELARIMGERFASQRGVMVAFNKSIAMELQSRIDKYGFRNVQAMTLHSAGWSAWRRAGGLDWEPRVDSLKTHKIMREVLAYEEVKRFGETTRKLVAAAKGIGLVPGVQVLDWQASGIQNGLVEDCPEAWEGLIDHYGLDEDECKVDCARRVLARSIEVARETCDFDDMLFQPVISGVPFDKYDVVLVDESQDVSAIQMTMIERMVKEEGRVIAVGDRKQSIYGFCGAGTDSMDIFQRRFQMRELPLSVTYRCPRAVVLHSRQWVRRAGVE